MNSPKFIHISSDRSVDKACMRLEISCCYVCQARFVNMVRNLACPR